LNLEPGTRVDRYVLVEPLGEGGQGAVWKARDRLNGDALVALKLMSVAGARADNLERARREARALARLAHPSLVSCHGLFEDLKLDLLGYSMELVDGVSLRNLSHDERLDSGHIAAVLGHVARALGYLHQNGVFHRDVKLDNVVVRHNFWEQPSDPTSVKVVDLGIARITSDTQGLTQMGTVVGTISYLAPEILDPASVEGDVPEAARDVFAFGVTGWLLLTGRHPSGLPASAKIADYIRAYRAAREDSTRYPEPKPSDEIGHILAEALAVDHQKRIADGVALSARFGQLSDVAVVVHSMRGKVDAAAPTALFGATEAAAVADMKEPAPQPAGSGGKRGIVYATLVAAVGLGVYVAMKPEASISPPIAYSAPISPSSSAKPLAPTTDAAPNASATEDATAAEKECENASVCDCCPSGRLCGGESCDELLSEEDFRVRVGEVRVAGADASLLTTHPSAEICLNLAGSEKPPVCSALSAIKSDKPPSAGLYATAVDLVETGIDIEVRVPVEAGALRVAWKQGVKQSGGIPRKALCEGLVVADLTTHVSSYEVVLYLDPDSPRVPRPCR
jgi:eukaryotic-like serine/threonine-protein kinase